MPPARLKALSIRQPWAWAILHLGKDVENRSWRTHHRGRTLIHAGLGVTGRDVEAFLSLVDQDQELQRRLAAAGGLNVGELRRQTGGIVGAVTISDCVTRSGSAWFAGPYGFTLDDPQPLPFEPCAGQLGFFDPYRPPKPGNRLLTSRPPDLFKD